MFCGSEAVTSSPALYFMVLRTLFLPVGLVLEILTGILLQGQNIPISGWSVMGVRPHYLLSDA